jgi:hypothetical protein
MEEREQVMAETEKWFGYATRKDGAAKRVYADVPKGEKAYDYIAPLIPAGFRLQGYGPVDDEVHNV